MSRPNSRPKAAATLHRSIAALLTAHPGETDAKQLIRRLAREKISIAKSRGWEGPPFCPRILASMFGIKCRTVDHEIRGEGRILRQKSGKPIIEIRKGQMIERERFTIFHELAHTLFPDFCEFLPHHYSPVQDLCDSEKPFEHLCDLAASEMLFPLEDFENDLKSNQWPGFETIHKIRNRYNASIDATTYRLLEVAKTVSLGAAFLTDQRGDFSGKGPLWVKSFSKSSAFKGYVPSGVLPPWNSVTLDCYRNGSPITAPQKETWWIANKPRTWLVQAAKLPTVDFNGYPKVVAIFLPVGCQSSYPGSN